MQHLQKKLKYILTSTATATAFFVGAHTASAVPNACKVSTFCAADQKVKVIQSICGDCSEMQQGTLGRLLQEDCNAEYHKRFGQNAPRISQPKPEEFRRITDLNCPAAEGPEKNTQKPVEAKPVENAGAVTSDVPKSKEGSKT